jgi:hypothetical protein
LVQKRFLEEVSKDLDDVSKDPKALHVERLNDAHRAADGIIAQPFASSINYISGKLRYPSCGQLKVPNLS